MLVKEQIFINHIDFYSAVEKSICVDVWIKVKTVIHNEEMPSLFHFSRNWHNSFVLPNAWDVVPQKHQTFRLNFSSEIWLKVFRIAPENQQSR